MIQLQKSRAVVDPEDIGHLKIDFEKKHCAVLPELLHSGLQRILFPRLEGPGWRQKKDEGIATEDVLDDLLTRELLNFMTNAPDFLEAIRNISDCPALGSFHGRVYRFLPDSNHYDSWHDDFLEGKKRVGMSINLGPRKYGGGILQIREAKSKQMVVELANTGWGDATLFRISDRLEHQVTAVTGIEPRIAFAGWFQSDTEDFHVSLLNAAARMPQ